MELLSFDDMAKAFHSFDAVEYDYTNLPAWTFIQRQSIREESSVMTFNLTEMLRMSSLDGFAGKPTGTC